MIFGQHGVSTTQQAFLKEAGLGEDSVPSLVIVPMAEESNTIYCIDLQKGDRDGELDDSRVWGLPSTKFAWQRPATLLFHWIAWRASAPARCVAARCPAQ